jgi:predicted transcriptional regulator
MIDPVNNLQSDSEIQKDTATSVANSQETTADEEQVNLNRESQDALGRRLQQVYGRLVAEPLPDKVMELLAKLARDEPEPGTQKPVEEDK